MKNRKSTIKDTTANMFVDLSKITTSKIGWERKIRLSDEIWDKTGDKTEWFHNVREKIYEKSTST